MKVSVVSKRRSVVGEGPHWDGQGNLWHVDVMSGDVCKLNPLTQETESRNLGGYASLVIPYSSDPSNRLLVTKDRQLRSMLWNSPPDEYRVLAEPETGNTRFNDGKCDVTGRLWLGSMGIESAPAVLEPNEGSLYSVGKDLQLKKHVGSISISNGLAWTRDNKTMFFIDSYDKTVTAFDFDHVQGTVSNRRTVYELGASDGYPDGMCIDSQDHIWVACYAAAQVIAIDPATGKRIQTVQMPAPLITSCCFGGSDYEDMYVTSASVNMQGVKQTEEAGAVFKVSGLGVKGLPPTNFSG